MLGRRRSLLERVASFALVALMCVLVAAIYLALKPLHTEPTQGNGAEANSPASAPSALSEQQLQVIWQGRDPQQPDFEPLNARDLLKPQLASADTLPFKLRGIIYATDGISVAFIETGGKVSLYGTDAMVAGWRVSAIEISAVTVIKDGEERTLTIYRNYASRPMAIASSALTRGAPARKERGKARSFAGKNQGKSGGVEVRSSQSSSTSRRGPLPPLQGAHGRVAVPQALVDTIRTDPTNLEFGAHYSTSLDRQGKMRGYAIDQVKPGSLAARYGLAPGDRILAVNGQAISSPQRVAQLYRRYRNSSSVRVKIERGGQVREFIYYAQ